MPHATVAATKTALFVAARHTVATLKEGARGGTQGSPAER